MGQVSFNEDIIERLIDDVGMLKTNLATNETSLEARQRHMNALRDTCDKIASELDKLRTLAKDPDIHLAKQMRAEAERGNSLFKENQKLRDQVRTVSGQLQQQEKKFEEALAAERARTADLGTKLNRLIKERDFEREDFGRLVDKYPPHSKR